MGGRGGRPSETLTCVMAPGGGRRNENRKRSKFSSFFEKKRRRGAISKVAVCERRWSVDGREKKNSLSFSISTSSSSFFVPSPFFFPSLLGLGKYKRVAPRGDRESCLFQAPLQFRPLSRKKGRRRGEEAEEALFCSLSLSPLSLLLPLCFSLISKQPNCERTGLLPFPFKRWEGTEGERGRGTRASDSSFFETKKTLFSLAGFFLSLSAAAGSFLFFHNPQGFFPSQRRRSKSALSIFSAAASLILSGFFRAPFFSLAKTTLAQLEKGAFATTERRRGKQLGIHFYRSSSSSAISLSLFSRRSEKTKPTMPQEEATTSASPWSMLRGANFKVRSTSVSWSLAQMERARGRGREGTLFFCFAMPFVSISLFCLSRGPHATCGGELQGLPSFPLLASLCAAPIIPLVSRSCELHREASRAARERAGRRGELKERVEAKKGKAASFSARRVSRERSRNDSPPPSSSLVIDSQLNARCSSLFSSPSLPFPTTKRSYSSFSAGTKRKTKTLQVPGSDAAHASSGIATVAPDAASDAAAAALSPSPSPEWKSPTRAVTETSLAVNPEPMTLSFKVREEKKRAERGRERKGKAARGKAIGSSLSLPTPLRGGGEREEEERKRGNETFLRNVFFFLFFCFSLPPEPPPAPVLSPRGPLRER